MKRAGAALMMAGLVSWSVSVFAQGRDFAGSWVVDSEKTAATMSTGSSGGGGRGGRGGAVGGMRTGGGGSASSGVGSSAVAGNAGGGGGGRGGSSSGAPLPTVITLDSSKFTVGAGEMRTTYRLDGVATTIERPNGTVTAKASWVGDKLTIEAVTDTPNGPVTSTTTWYLEGEWLVREASSMGASGQPMVRKTYYKRA